MKNLLIILGSLLLIALVVFGITKYTTSSSTISLTNNNSGQTINTKVGNTITITLNNPGDGGYEFTTPTYDNKILKLEKSAHISAQTGLSGDFGTDTWTYKVIAKGNTQLKIDSVRPWDTNDKVNNLTVTIIAE